MKRIYNITVTLLILVPLWLVTDLQGMCDTSDLFRKSLMTTGQEVERVGNGDLRPTEMTDSGFKPQGPEPVESGSIAGATAAENAEFLGQGLALLKSGQSLQIALTAAQQADADAGMVFRVEGQSDMFVGLNSEGNLVKITPDADATISETDVTGDQIVDAMADVAK